MDDIKPTVGLHLWLETDEGTIFGSGRAQLLESISKNGSLKKSAEKIRISYRAAWGKIKKTEEILGNKKLVQPKGVRKGYEITEFGNELNKLYLEWCEKVKNYATKEAETIFSLIHEKETNSTED